MKCAACGAILGASQANCAFCGALTPFGREQQHLAQQHAAHAHAFHLHRHHQHESDKRGEATRSLKRTSDASMYWGIAGWVLCCAFIPSLVAIVLGVRARKMAHRYDLVIPTTATLGLVFGALGLISGAGLIIIGVVQNHQRDAEIAEIDGKLEGRLEAAVIDQPTACLLAKRSLLKGEFQEKDGSLDSFDCDGKLTVSGDEAVLENLRFSRSSSDRNTVRVCLARGARWSVAGFRRNASCREADDVTPPATSGT
jgi:hypothetical protein